MNGEPPDERGDRGPASLPDDVRRRAEERVARARRDPETVPPEEWPTLLHDLQVHQVELELQNEELRRTHAALEASRDRYADLYDFAPVGYLTLDDHGRIREANLTAARLLGPARSWLTDVPLLRFVDGADRSALVAHLRRARADAGAGEQHLEVTLTPRGGPARPVALQTIVATDRATETPSLRVALIDLTALRRAEEAGRETAALLALTTEAAGAAAGSVDLATGALAATDAALALFGLPPDAPLQVMDAIARVHPDDRSRLEAALRDARETGAAVHEEFRVRLPDGALRWLAARACVRESSSGRRLAGLVMDVTAQKQVEAALVDLTTTLEAQVAERTRVAEERAERMRRLSAALTHAEQRERQRIAQFLHDQLQQALVAARMHLADVLEEPALDAALRDRVDLPLQLVDECIAASRDLTLDLSPPIARHATLREALAWLGRRFGDRHDLAVTVAAPDELPAPTEHVRVLLFQAARELLFNVVKHAGVGEARVEVDAPDGALRIAVVDVGCGVDPDVLADDRGDADLGGVGLFGLRERLRILGGDLSVATPEGGGARVTVTVPREPEAPRDERGDDDGATPAAPDSEVPGPREPAHRPAPSDRRVRVLVVDDHGVMRQGLVSLLERQADVEVVGEAANGEEALRQTLSLAPDVAVMDVSMPRMNGVEATRLVRKLYPSTAVVGLTLHEEEEVARAMLDAGAVASLRKDGPFEALLAAIRAAAHPAD